MRSVARSRPSRVIVSSVEVPNDVGNTGIVWLVAGAAVVPEAGAVDGGVVPPGWSGVVMGWFLRRAAGRVTRRRCPDSRWQSCPPARRRLHGWGGAPARRRAVRDGG